MKNHFEFYLQGQTLLNIFNMKNKNLYLLGRIPHVQQINQKYVISFLQVWTEPSDPSHLSLEKCSSHKKAVYLI